MGEALITSIYWDKQTKKRVQDMAKKDRRSVSAMICYLIDEEYRRRHHHVQILPEERAPYTTETAP